MRYLSLNELIYDADDRVAFVRPSRIREKNLFASTRDAAGLIEWHMPLVPSTIVKRNAVMWNSRSGLRLFFGTGPPFTYSADHKNLRSLVCFCPLSNGAPHRDRTGVSRRRTPSALPAKLAARALSEATVLASTTATTLVRPPLTPADAINGHALHPASSLESQPEHSAALLRK